MTVGFCSVSTQPFDLWFSISIKSHRLLNFQMNRGSELFTPTDLFQTLHVYTLKQHKN